MVVAVAGAVGVGAIDVRRINGVAVGSDADVAFGRLGEGLRTTPATPVVVGLGVRAGIVGVGTIITSTGGCTTSITVAMAVMPGMRAGGCARLRSSASAARTASGLSAGKLKPSVQRA
jgi:hypothetical protein